MKKNQPACPVLLAVLLMTVGIACKERTPAGVESPSVKETSAALPLEDNSVWGKNIVYTTQPVPETPPETTNLGESPEGMVRQITYLDDQVLPGAFYAEVSWLMKAYPDKVWVTEHVHDWDEIFGLYGSDPDNPNELNGEIELWIDGEQHLITRSCLIFVPKGVKHCPLKINRIDKPILFFTTGPSGTYRF